MLIIPITGTNHIIGDSQRAELAMEYVTEGAGLITGDHLPAAGHLLANPFEQIHRFESLRWLGTGTVLLRGDDVPRQVRINGDLEQRFDGGLIYRLPDGNRRSRKNALMHVGRYCGTRVRPES